MPVTRTQAEQIFNDAWYQFRYRNSGPGSHLANGPDDIARTLWATLPHGAGYTYLEVRNIARSAINSFRDAQRLEADPLNRHALLAADMADNPGIDRRRGQYEYRVVVRGSDIADPNTAFETLVFVRSRTKMSGQEIIEEATQAFVANSGLHRNYAGRIGALGPTPQIDAHIISASRNPG